MISATLNPQRSSTIVGRMKNGVIINKLDADGNEDRDYSYITANESAFRDHYNFEGRDLIMEDGFCYIGTDDSDSKNSTKIRMLLVAIGYTLKCVKNFNITNLYLGGNGIHIDDLSEFLEQSEPRVQTFLRKISDKKLDERDDIDRKKIASLIENRLVKFGVMHLSERRIVTLTNAGCALMDEFISSYGAMVEITE